MLGGHKSGAEGSGINAGIARPQAGTADLQLGHAGIIGPDGEVCCSGIADALCIIDGPYPGIRTADRHRHHRQALCNSRPGTVALDHLHGHAGITAACHPAPPGIAIPTGITEATTDHCQCSGISALPVKHPGINTKAPAASIKASPDAGIATQPSSSTTGKAGTTHLRPGGISTSNETTTRGKPGILEHRKGTT